MDYGNFSSRLFSLVTAFIFAVSSLFVSPVFADEAANELKIMYDGSRQNSTVNSGNMLRLASVGSGISCAVKSAAPLKESGDYTYKLSGTAQKALGNGISHMRPETDVVAGNTKAYKYTSLAFDVLFETDGSGLFYRFDQFKSDGSGACTSGHYNIYVGTSGAQNGVTMTTETIVSKNKWHKVSIVYGSDGSENNNTLSVYIDGVLDTSCTLTEGGYGTYTGAPNGYLCLSAAKDAQYTAYLDNICVYAGNGQYTGGDKSRILRTDSYTARLGNDFVETRSDVTAASLKSGITASSGASVGIYDSSLLPKADDAIVSADDILTVVSSEGLYSYYDISICSLEDNGVDKLMDNLAVNTVSNTFTEPSDGGWYKQGGNPTISSVFDSTQNADCVQASNRPNYTSGIQQKIYYDSFYKKSWDNPGDSSVYSLSYYIKSVTDQRLTIAVKWYVNGTDAGLSDSSYTYTAALKQNEWTRIQKNINLKVPESISSENYENTYLRIYIIGGRSGVDTGDFSICSFRLSKIFAGKIQNISIDDENTIGTVSQNALGYAYEGGNYWYGKASGGSVSKMNKCLKESYLDYARNIGFKAVRIGGFMSNYELWKRSIGNVQNRTAYCYPRAQVSTLTYSLPSVEYIGMTERVKLAQTYNPDAKIIMCVNMWSAEPTANNMNDETGTVPNISAVYPVKIMRNLNEYNGNLDETIDEEILNIAINNVLDEMRFWLCDENDSRRFGADGTDWAAKRQENGFENPVEIYCWELGNELYIRKLSSAGYINLAQRFITAIKAVFPEVKLAVHTTAAYNNWAVPIIEQLGNQVDFISTHNYYNYKASASTAKNKVIADAISAVNNPNLKLLVTEGGLDTFPKEYAGPSNKTIAASLSFADYFNNVVKLGILDGFQYYGDTAQLIYNDGTMATDGYSELNSAVNIEYGANGGKDVYTAANRKAFNAGVQYIVSGQTLKDSCGFAFGGTAGFDLAFDYMLSGGDLADNGMQVKVQLQKDSDYNNNIVLNQSIRNIEKGKWHTFNSDFQIEIPEDFDENIDRYRLRIIIFGIASNVEFSDISVSDMSLIKSGMQNNITTGTLNIGEYVTDNYHDTALAELIKYYLDNCSGSIVSAVSSSNIIAENVSCLAVKTQNGIRLFLSNISETNDYSINFDTDKTYRISKKFAQSADNLYASREIGKNDIVTVNETYENSSTVSGITLPKLTVTVIDLEEN